MRKKFFFLAYLFINGALAAQQYSFVRFTSDNGLTNNVVYTTFQDSRGFLWIATHDGLNRYDGYEFKKFIHNPFDKKSLAGNMTIDVAEDEYGRLWVLTSTHLHLYNERSGSFERYLLPVGSINHSNQSASKMINGTHRYLLLNLFNGLFVFDKIDRRFKPVTVNQNDAILLDVFGLPFFKDPDGTILVGGGAKAGVFAFDSTSISLTNQMPAGYGHIKWQNETVTSIYKSKNNVLIYGTQEQDKFYLITPGGRKHFLLNRSITGTTFFIESIAEDIQGDLWIAYGNRLFEFLPGSDSVIDMSAKLYNTSAGNNFIIKDICIDNFNNLWIGLYEAGLLKASVRKSFFLNFAINQQGPLKLPYSSIYDLIKNPDETVIARYFGTQAASVIDIIQKKVITPEFTFNATDPSVIKRVFPQFQTIKSSQPYYKYFNASTRMTFNNGQFGLYRDHDGNYWSVNFNEFRRVSDNKSFNTGVHINCFYESDSSTFWIGSDGSGLIKFNYNNGLLKKFLPNESNTKSISSEYVDGIIPDENKGLWLATRYGLNYFDFRTGQFKLFSEESGLCNNTIYTMEKDKEGKLWLGTSNGLSCYDPHTNEFTNFTKNNGLVNSEYNRNSSTALANGWILMGGTEGIDLIIPDSIKYRRETEKKHPPLIITMLKAPDTLFNSVDRAIQLTHRQNNIQISFSALDFTQPYNNKYLWKLEPLEDKWIYGLGKHEVHYAGLPPGNYTFKIKAAGADGIWNEKETSFSFIISAPWWQSPWAIVVVILIGIGLLAGMLRLYYRRKFKLQLGRQLRLSEKQQAVEKERTRIATDIHDDLGSGLSRIRYLGETVKFKSSQQQDFLPEIEKISTFSDEMVDKMNEIVWALNEKNDSLEAIISYARSFAVEYLSNNNIECEINLPIEIPPYIIKGETRRNIFLSVKECLHNIVKHAKATKADISISLNGHLAICIHDNGKGIDWDRLRPFSNGITNIKKRMKEAGGTAEFKSVNGTTVTLIIPL